MSIDGALRAGRAAAERVMSDTVTVSYIAADAEPTTDPDTGASTYPLTVRFTSPARFKSDDVQPIAEEAGGATKVGVRVTMQLPAMTDPLPEVGDKVRIDAVGPESNPARVGLEYEVVGEPIGTHETKLRVPVRRWAT